MLDTSAHGFSPPSLRPEIGSTATPSPREANFHQIRHVPASSLHTTLYSTIWFSISLTSTSPSGRCYPTRTPSPPNLFPESNTAPLRITKWSPMSRPPDSAHNIQLLSLFLLGFFGCVTASGHWCVPTIGYSLSRTPWIQVRMKTEAAKEQQEHCRG
ncbi:hypothetical protein BYT27DRAFT_7341738 [Phlegmacium glaucopus]|nr:hypothetical protein BYT27DRAFT_7341738 [Phlegmacium glaucopus]